jgi:hypothetical protein
VGWLGKRTLSFVAAAATVVLVLCGGAGAIAAEPAPKPPLVWSGQAISIKGTTVVLSGWVKPRGQLTTCRFEVGTTTSYNSFSEPNEFEPHGYRNQEIFEAIPGLRPHTTYHFRLVAHSRGGTTYGKDKTFRTGRKAN